MSDKEEVTSFYTGGDLVIKSLNGKTLAEPLNANAGDHVRIYRGADGKLHGEIVPPPPKEPRYRRKPLEWEYKQSRTKAWAWYQAVAFGNERFYIDQVGLGGYTFLGCEPCTLEEAKFRVEAEITRRLASVLEVCDD